MALKRKVADADLDCTNIEELRAKNEELIYSLEIKEVVNQSLKRENETMKTQVEDNKVKNNRNMEVFNKLKERIECPVCLEIPRSSPVFVCPNGHIVCTSCKREMCPSCRDPMGKGKSLLAETLIENIQHQCKHTSCEEYFDLNQIEDHEKKCANRSVECPKTLCKEVITLSKLMDHLIKKHCDLPFVMENSFRRQFILQTVVETQSIYWGMKLFDFQGTKFAFMPQKHDDFYCFPVVMFGSVKECLNYKVKVEVFERSAIITEDSGSSLRFFGVPYSIDGDKALVKYDGLVVNKLRLEKLMDKEKAFILTVSFFKN